MINCQESQSSFINGPNCYRFPIKTDSHNLPFQKFCTAIASCICRHTIYISQYTLLIIILYDCARTFILYKFHCFFWGGHSQPPHEGIRIFFLTRTWLALPILFARLQGQFHLFRAAVAASKWWMQCHIDRWKKGTCFCWLGLYRRWNPTQVYWL